MAYFGDVRILAKIVDEESDRLCAIMDSATTREVRDQAFRELNQLARNVSVIISALQESPAESEHETEYELKAA